MLTGISSEPLLAGLTTRDTDDPSIALVDAWATVLDVLTFYQERIANEAYLRTASERRSILELSRSIGYELRPGVAASTFLALTINTRTGAPTVVRIPSGLKAQSVPGQDELPQIFETIEEVEARGVWNELRARSRKLVLPAFGDKDIYLKGTATELKAGDAIVIVGDERLKESGNENWDFRRVTAVSVVQPDKPIDPTDPQADPGYTVVTLDHPLGKASPFVAPAKDNPQVYALRQRASLFGFNAPDWRAMPNVIKAGYLGVPESQIPSSAVEWPNFTIAGISDPPAPGTGTGLRAEYFNTINLTHRALIRTDATVNFNWGAGSPAPVIGATTFSARWTGWIQPKVRGLHMFSVVVEDGVRLWINNQPIINSWIDRSTPATLTGSINLIEGTKYNIKVEFYSQGSSSRISLSWSAPGLTPQIVPQTALFPRDIFTVHLDAAYPKILAGSWLVLSKPEYQELYQVNTAVEDSRTNFTITAKTTRLTLQGENLLALFNEKVRETVVFAQSEALELAERPILAEIAGNSIVLDSKIEELAKGRPIEISGEDAAGKEQAEVSELLKTDLVDGLTCLVFKASLQHSYKPETVTLNANVAKATHGETKTEVLGSGDASTGGQKFELKNKPLTHVSATTPRGTASTLEMTVNGVQWREAATFYEMGPHEKRFISRQDEAGRTTVLFGDGVHGSRLPTGSENVSAKYRVGLGLSGNVNAKQISLPLTLPLGLNAVINPVAASGGADAEASDQARVNAPLNVLTLDRIVSVQDFEDFARAFGGIGKAQAVWLWNGERRIVHLTVAAADGGAVLQNSKLSDNLQSAIAAVCDSTQRFLVDSYTPLTFKVVVKVRINADYLIDKVLAAITSAVTEAFAFEQRTFGGAITSSEVIALIQKIEGVVFVDLDSLQCVESLIMKPPLIAQIAHRENNMIKPAELLTLSKAADSLKVITI